MQNQEPSQLEIVPAILAEDEASFFGLIKKAAEFAPRIQLDFMDGRFVPSLSVPVSTIREAVKLLDLTGPALEAHLMVYNPEHHINELKSAGVGTAIFHYEAVADPVAATGVFKEAGFEVGMAVNPETPLEKIEPFALIPDFFLFMTVRPGYYGSPLEPEALEKMAEFHRRHPHILLAVDGAVKLDNLNLFIKAGATRICVGSAIMKAPDPAQAYAQFLKRIKEKVG